MWQIEVDQNLCDGCDICLNLCPKKVFAESDRLALMGFKERMAAFPEKCVGCMICEELCPKLAITVNPVRNFEEIQKRLPKNIKISNGVKKERKELPIVHIPTPFIVPKNEGEIEGGWKEASHLLTPGRHFLSGNQAISEGALAAGCQFFAGYPITPASRALLEYLAERMPELGRKFIQPEDEMASAWMIIGASIAGSKSMTATSGPGFSLIQEAISWALMAEIPTVIVDVQRAGPSTGQPTKTGAYDVREGRWGSHGGNARIDLYPDSVEECYWLTIKAFNLAEIFRIPVILFSDATLANLYEVLEIPEGKVRVFERIYDPSKPPFGPTDDFSAPSFPKLGQKETASFLGTTHDPWGKRATEDPEIQEKLIFHLDNKVYKNRRALEDTEILFVDEDCELLIVAYGSAARSAKEAQKMARAKGYKVGLVRPRVLWPFPERIIRELPKRIKRIIVPEINQGQVAPVVRESTSKEVVSLPQPNGEPIDPRRILRFIEREIW